jgi:hypothetical protein
MIRASPHRSLVRLPEGGAYDKTKKRGFCDAEI